MDQDLRQCAPFLVLIVEDEVLVAMDMEERVQSLGYAVLGPAPSVAAAGSLLDLETPGAALLDVELRGERVSPIAERLRQLGIPFALVTGYARLPLDDPALVGAPRLSKPVAESELASMLRKLLRREGLHEDEGGRS